MMDHLRQLGTTVITAAVGSGGREVAVGGTISAGGLLAMAAGWLGGYDKPLQLLIVLMLADYVSGVAGAFKTKTVSSDIMFWGGIRKVTVLFVIGLAALVDNWVQPGAPIFRMAAILFYAGREGLSVVENFGVLGVPMPDKLKDYLLQLSEDKARNNPAKPEHPDNAGDGQRGGVRMSYTLAQVKAKSAARLVGLHPVVKAATEALIDRSYACGVPILITQGLRTIAEQNALYAQGRTRPGAIVTNARGGESFHNYGFAVDFALLLPDGSSVSWDMKRDGDKDGTADWQEVVQEAKSLGFEWGGNWTSFKDYPHLQMAFGLRLADLRAGKKPAAAAVEAVYERIKPKEDNKVSKEVKVSVLVNGKKVADGMLDGGTTYTPARAVAEALGATVVYDAATKTVKITSSK